MTPSLARRARWSHSGREPLSFWLLVLAHPVLNRACSLPNQPPSPAKRGTDRLQEFPRQPKRLDDGGTRDCREGRLLLEPGNSWAQPQLANWRRGLRKGPHATHSHSSLSLQPPLARHSSSRGILPMALVRRRYGPRTAGVVHRVREDWHLWVGLGALAWSVPWRLVLQAVLGWTRQACPQGRPASKGE